MSDHIFLRVIELENMKYLWWLKECELTFFRAERSHMQALLTRARQCHTSGLGAMGQQTGIRLYTAAVQLRVLGKSW